MRSEIMPHDWGAVRDQHGRGWMARFSAPTTGTRWVRDANRMIILYASEDAAKRAAERAYLAAVNAPGPEPRSLAAKVFRVSGGGRNRRAILSIG